MLKISLLGPLQITYDDSLASSFISEKARALLCYLAVTKQPHSRDALVGLFWGEDEEAKAKNSLRVALTNIRKLFPKYIEANRQTVHFVTEIPYWLDIHEFERHRFNVSDQQLPLKQLQTIGALYRGVFLADFQTEGMPAFAEWLFSQRAYWGEKASQLFTNLAKRQIAEQAYKDGAATLRRLLELEPWQEEAHRQLMLALSHLGDFNGALVQYETCRQLLADELNVTPMPETAALYQRILLAREGRPANLPISPTPLIGRKEEIGQISQMLLNPECRLVTIVGIGGLGKTRLALAVGNHLNQEAGLLFLNGLTFVALQSVAATTSDVEAVATAVAQALDLYLPGRRPPSEEVVDYLQPEEQLLIFDNFEHLQGGASWLATLLQRCPHVKLLITSREPLNLTAEWRFNLGGLPFPNLRESDPAKEDVRAAESYEAVQLFLQAAKQARPNFTLTNDNRGHVFQLCQLVMGMPLALNLAASWLRLMPTAQLATELKRNLDILSTEMEDVPERQRTVRAVIDATWLMLQVEAQQMLAGLSVFRGGFSVEAAQAVTAVSPIRLAALQDRGLLQYDADASRYVLHELVRQYAAEKLANSPETAVHTRNAHTHYYAQLLDALMQPLAGAEPQVAYTNIHQEIDNLRHAWQHAVQQLDLTSLRQLMGPLFLFYERQGWFVEGKELIGTAVSAIQAANLTERTAVRLQGELLARQGALIGRIGQFNEAESTLHKSIEKARQAADPHLLSFALIESGRLLRDQSRFTEAAALFQEGLDIAIELNEPLLLATATEKVGTVTWDLGQHEEAEAELGKALTQFRALQNARQIANTLNSLGNVLMSAGKNMEALDRYKEALPMLRDLEDWLMLDTVLINLGMVSQNLGESEKSRLYYEESLAICRRIGDKIGVAYCLTGIGIAELAEQQLASAQQHFEQSLALNREMARDRYVAINLNFLGDVAQKREAWATAHTHYEESLAISEAISHPWGVASSHLRLGELATAQKDETAASQHYLRALQLGQEMTAQGTILTALTNLAGLLLNQGEVETAVFVLTVVQKQPTLSDSLRQTVADMLGGEQAISLPDQHVKIESWKDESLETVMEAILAKYSM